MIAAAMATTIAATPRSASPSRSPRRSAPSSRFFCTPEKTAARPRVGFALRGAGDHAVLAERTRRTFPVADYLSRPSRASGRGVSRYHRGWVCAHQTHRNIGGWRSLGCAPGCRTADGTDAGAPAGLVKPPSVGKGCWALQQAT